MVVARIGQEENGELLFNGYRVSVLEKMRRVLEMEGGDGCIVM